MSFQNTNSVPRLLQPLSYCGRQWRSLSHIEATSQAERVQEIIKKIIPGLLLLLATIFSTVVGIGGAVMQSRSFDTTVLFDVPESLKTRLEEILRGVQAEDEVAEKILSRGFQCSSVGVSSMTHQLAERPLPPENVHNIRLNNLGEHYIWPVDRLIETFQGTPPLEVEASDVVQLIFGEPLQADAARKAMKSAKRTELFVAKNFSKIRLQISSPSPIYLRSPSPIPKKQPQIYQEITLSGEG